MISLEQIKKSRVREEKLVNLSYGIKKQVLYIEPNKENFTKESFHFIRKSKYNFWFSKPVWIYQPILENIIDVKNYSDFQIVKCKYQFCVIEYKNIGYFAVAES